MTPSSFSYQKNFKNTQQLYNYGAFKAPKLSYDLEYAIVKVIDK